MNPRRSESARVYRSRAPLRLGLAGGGTDVSPFSEIHGGYVLNATINLYAHAILEPRSDGIICFRAVDRGEEIEVPEIGYIEPGTVLPLHVGIYNYLTRLFNRSESLAFTLTTFADAPAGSGLGTSSTMVVCIIQVFSEWLGLGLGEYDIANLAYSIERVELRMAGGKQDQYAAAFGGFNFIEFGPGEERVVVNPLRIKETTLMELESSLLLFHTGQSRESSSIIKEQIRNISSNNSIATDSLLSMKADAVATKEALLRSDLTSYVALMEKSWLSKKTLANNVTNPLLDGIYNAALNAGAVSGKISGAGGGGFFMFFVRPELRFAVINELNKQNGHLINFHFTMDGATSWSYTRSF